MPSPQATRPVPAAQRAELDRWAATLDGDWRVVEATALAADEGAEDETGKAGGYGHPIRVRLAAADGRCREVVFHLAGDDEFGHDRRADRALEQLLAFDTFAAVPRHVRAIDVGAVAADGRLVSWRDGGEPYLVTEWAPGHPYAEDLRAIARRQVCEPADLARVDALADYLVDLHRLPVAEPPRAYLRAARDLVGSGEGIFGMIDAYPPGTPGAPLRRLQAIERACVDWRWRLKRRVGRLRRIHGDFHPFNIVVGEGADFLLLDASRGCLGDPADDVSAMAINFVFFAVEHPQGWPAGLGPLWRRFWARYLARTGDDGLLEVVAPFLAWRALVVASPRFYPHLHGDARDRILELAERALAASRFDPAWAEAVFRADVSAEAG